jgi:hypothetical protein
MCDKKYIKLRKKSSNLNLNEQRLKIFLELESNALKNRIFYSRLYLDLKLNL